MKKDLIKLSRTISHALRHAPEEYGIELDSQGWVKMDLLLQALMKQDKKWQGLLESDLYAMAAAGEKQRYEFDQTRIRAIYGHSTSQPIEYEPSQPPALLFHGTTAKAADQILTEGLKAMKRQYVHLAPDLETATQVALRRTADPVILKIDAARAFEDGVEFYNGNQNVWLARKIDSRYISRAKQ